MENELYVDNNFVFTDVNGYPLVIKTAIMDKSYT